MEALSVSELNAQIKSLLEATFLQVSVRGEVSNCTHHTSGHIYFTLKDEKSTLKCVMFRGNATKLRFKIEEGMKLFLSGGITLYTPRGEYQLNCSYATPDGVGELTLAYEQLKKEYQAKGYFENKKKLPHFPKKVALITSKTGAVLHDMLSVAQKRWELTEFLLLNTLVQGEGAKEEIAKNIIYADSLNVDCIIIARGGGSLEDLWAFNEPLVIEAIFSAKTPIISAIGHEPDTMLSDFVADVRAPTPSAAMEILLPDKNEIFMLLDSMQNAIENKMNLFLNKRIEKLNFLKTMLEKNSFVGKIGILEEKLNFLEKAFGQKVDEKLNKFSYKILPFLDLFHQKIQESFYKKHNALLLLQSKLESKNPKNFQKKGYVFIRQKDKALERLSNLKIEDEITLEDMETKILAKVSKVF